MTEKPVIFTQGNTNLAVVLEGMDDIRFVVGTPAIAQLMRDMSLEVANLEDAVDVDVLHRAKIESLWLQQKIQDALMAGDLAALDTTISALHSPEIQGWLPAVTLDLLLHTITRLKASERIIEEHGIDGVLLHEDVTIDGRWMAALGAKHGVPVMHIPHANHFIPPDTGDIHATSRSDFIGAWGPYMRDWYVKAGANPDIITMIGAGHWDELYNDKTRLTQEHAKRCLGMDGDAKVWLYATSWAQDTDAWGRGQEDLFDSMRWVLDEARHQNANLIVKLHPHEQEANAQRYLDMVKESGVKTSLTSHYNGHSLVASDIVITQGSSNLAVEAAIIGRPIVEMWQPGTKYPEQYQIPGTWGPDISAVIRMAIDQGVNEKFLNDMNIGPGSKDRTQGWIRGIINADNKE